MGFVVRRRDVLGFGALAGLALLAQLHLDSGHVLVGRVLAGEICAFAALALLLSRHTAVRATLRGLGPLYRILVVVLPALVVAGHVVDRADRAYPFITWELYTAPLPANLAYHEYTLSLASGREIALPVRRLFPSLVAGLSVSLENITWNALHRGSAAERERATARLQMVLVALAREYERRHPDGAVRAIDVWHRTIPVESYRGRASIARRHDRRVDAP